MKLRMGLWGMVAILLAAYVNCSPVTRAEDAGKKYLIIHSDDAGMCHSVNMGTEQGLKSGIVTSASIMVPCPWFKEFARFAEKHPEYDYGIHLTLNSEWDNYRWGPVAPRELVPSLVDPEGYLWDSTQEVAQFAKADEVKIELKAQIDRAIAFRVPLTHLDTHMGSLVAREDLVKVYVELALEYDLPILFFGSLSDDMKRAYPALAAQMASSAALLRDRKLPILDDMLQFYGGDSPELRKKQYFDALSALKPGVTELIIHCGVENEELRGVTDSSKRRDQDRVLFSDPDTKKWLDEQGIELITWKQFRAMVQ